MKNKIDDTVINFQNITVQSIGQSSGIFVGKNNAIGWSTHGKSNQGLGSVKGKVMQSINMVYDNDLIDSPIDDRDLIVQENMYSTEVKETANISFDEINATSLSNNAAVSVGHNSQHSWKSHSKANSGIGDGTTLCNNVGIIGDADMMDSTVNLQNK